MTIIEQARMLAVRRASAGSTAFSRCRQIHHGSDCPSGSRNRQLCAAPGEPTFPWVIETRSATATAMGELIHDEPPSRRRLMMSPIKFRTAVSQLAN
jgi:hypothetical protein